MTARTTEAHVALAQAGTRGLVHVAAQQNTGTWVARCGRQVRGQVIREHALATFSALPMCPACVDLALGVADNIEDGLAALLGGVTSSVALTLVPVRVTAVRVPETHVRVPDAGLAASIREHGVLAPIVVAREGLGYVLVVGGRRLAGARAAGLDVIPALVREPSPLAALVENLHREALDPIATARAMRAIVDGGSSIAALAASLGMSRPTASNTLRLLGLASDTQEHIAAGRLTAAHGLALLAIPAEDREQAEQDALAGASVAETQRASRKPSTRVAAPDLAAALAAHLGIRVTASRDGSVTRLILDVPDADLPRVLAALEP